MGDLRDTVLAVLKTFDTAGWHTGLGQALEGISSSQALWRPAEGQHCIWDHVNHVTVWAEELSRTLTGRPRRPELYSSLEPGWPPPGEAGGDGAWQAAVDKLRAAHEGLVKTVAGLTDENLAQPSSKGAPRAAMIIGCANHYSYHGGQIILLRRLQGLWETDA